MATPLPGRSMNDERAHDALALAERALAHADARGRQRGRGPGHGRGRRPDPVRQQPDPPERGRDQRRREPAVRRSASGSASPSTGRTDEEGLRRLAENAAAIARVVEELEDWAGLPAADARSRTSPAAYAPGHRRAPRRSCAPRASGRSSPPPTPPGSPPTARSRPAPRRRRSPTRRGIRAGGTPDRRPAPDRLDGPRRRHRLRRAGRRRRHDHRCRGDRPRSGDEGPARPRTRSPSMPATTRSSSRSTPSSTCSTCSATSGSPPSPSRRSAASSSSASGSARDLVTIVDDGRDPAGLPMAFDYEGVAKQRVTLLDARRLPRRRLRRPDGGAGRRHLHRPRPAGPESVRSVPAQPGHGRGRHRPRATSSRGLDRGLLVTRFHYTNPVHPKLAIVTGMTRDGTFLVEDGRIVGPVKNLRFTQSYLDALAGVVGGRPRAQDAQGLPGRRRRPGAAPRGLDVHGDDRTLTPMEEPR